MSYASHILADNPAWYYRFDEPSGTFVDESPNAVTTTITGAPTYGVDSPIVGDGTATTWGTSAYLTLNYTAPSLTGETIEGWFRTTSTGTVVLMQNRGNSPGLNGKALQLAIGPTSFGAAAGQVTAYMNATSFYFGKHTTGTINDGNWHHVVATWAASAAVTLAPSQITIYVDGVAAATTNDSGTGSEASPAIGSGFMTLFKNVDGPGRTAIVDADEMAFYPGALAAARVLDHFDAGSAGPTYPGVWIDWDEDGFDTGDYDHIPDADVRSWTITRGVSGDLSGASGSGSGTLILTDLDGTYNPQYAAGPLFGLLRDGPRVWIGVNDDGTTEYDADKAVRGLGAGRITSITPIPSPGRSFPATVEIAFEDPLAWIGRAVTKVADSRTRSQYDLRVAVLDDIAETGRDLCEEPTTIPLSSADGYAGNVLNAINQSNGTRHYAAPEDNLADWYSYTTVRRTANLDGHYDAALTGSDHVTTSGWVTSADTVVNHQEATITPIRFSAGRLSAWESQTYPIVVTDPITMWTPFDDFVDDPVVDVAYTGSALTATLTPFGHTAKLDLSSAGTSTISLLTVQGYTLERDVGVTLIADDLTSQAPPRGIRSGSDLSGDYLGIEPSAQGIVDHIVWRFADPLVRPDMVVVNLFPEMFELDLLSVIKFTSTHLHTTDRLFEIVGLTHFGEITADAVQLHTVTYQLQECKVQDVTTWFTWDVSEWDDADSPWAY